MSVSRPIKKLRQRRSLEALGIFTLAACLVVLLRPSQDKTPGSVASPTSVEQATEQESSIWQSIHPVELARRANERELSRMNALLAEQPDNVEHLYRRSWILGAKKDTDAQLADLNQVIELNPKRFPQAYVDRAVILAHRGQYHQALEDVQKNRYSTLDRRANETLAFIQVGMGRDEDVLPYFNAILMVDSSNLELLWGRATVLERLGRTEEAQADWNRARSLDPDYSVEWPDCTTCP